MIKKSTQVVYHLSPLRNIFNNAHTLYQYTNCYREMALINLFQWNYSETPAFRVRKA